MDVSIIIVNYNQGKLLEQCLKNIEEAQLRSAYEVIVIDNNSSDGSRQLLSKLKIKTIFNSQNLGFARAVNAGIVASKGKYILVLNPDVIVLPNSIEKLFNFMEDHPQCAVSGPQLLNPDKTVQSSSYHFPRWYTPLLRRTFLGGLKIFQKHLNYYLMLDWGHQSNREIDWLLGAVLMVRRKAIDEVGMMDERFFLYFEDVEWCRRFHRKNWQIYYVAETQMYHFHQRLSADRPGLLALFHKITWIHLISALKYFLK